MRQPKLFLALLLLLTGTSLHAQIQSNITPVRSNPIYFDQVRGDKLSLYGERINDANNYGFGVGDFTSYAKSYGNYAWMQNGNVLTSDNQFQIFHKSLMHLSRNNTDGAILTVREPNTSNLERSAEIRLLEKSTNGSTLYGGFLSYDGRFNKVRLGVYTSGGQSDGLVMLRSNQYIGIGTESPSYRLDVAGPANLNKGTNGVALRVNAAEAIWYNDTYFSWGYGGQFNYFADRVGIGTNTPHPDYMLSVDGKIRAKEVRVESGWADFVFEESYQLPTLEEVEKFIEANGHLPGVPSAATIQKEGLSLGQLETTMMQKIEELTLYVIDLKKENDALKQLILDK